MGAPSSRASSVTRAIGVAPRGTPLSTPPALSGDSGFATYGKQTLDFYSKIYNVCPGKFNIKKWESILQDYPNKALANEIINGLKYGFNIGFTGSDKSVIVENNRLTQEERDFFRSDIQKRLKKGLLLGPFKNKPTKNFRCSPLIAVPKGDTFRGIHNLSEPAGNSVNDFIDKRKFDISFDSIDDAKKLIAKLGRGCLLSKFDWEDAYRAIKIAPEDWHLLGFKFEGYYYCDVTCPMGCRSRARIQGQLAGVFKWALGKEKGIYDLLFFADDSLLVSKQENAAQDAKSTEEFYFEMGIPLSLIKREGPIINLKFLGMLFDTIILEMRVPPEKITDVLIILESFISKPKCTQRDVQSLVGKLIFISQAVPAGRAFCSRFLNLLSKFKKPSHRLRVTCEARLDAEWWLKFLKQFNGTSVITLDHHIDSKDLMFACDASLSGGGFFMGRQWSYVKWGPNTLGWSISLLEIYILVIAVATFGGQLANKIVHIASDNSATVYALKSRRVKNKIFMKYIRELHFLEAKFNCTIVCHHIETKLNIADPISRGNFRLFFQSFRGRYGFLPNRYPCAAVTDFGHSLA